MRIGTSTRTAANGSIVAAVTLAFLLVTTVALAQESAELDHAYRVTGVYENGRIVSLEAMPLEVRLPLTVTDRVITEATPPSGTYLEMLDRDQKALIRVLIDDPSFVLMEYVDPAEPDKIVNKSIHVDRAEFSILVPAPPGSRMLRFSKVASDQESHAADKRRTAPLGTFLLPESGVGPATRMNVGGEQ